MELGTVPRSRALIIRASKRRSRETGAEVEPSGVGLNIARAQWGNNANKTIDNSARRHTSNFARVAYIRRALPTLHQFVLIDAMRLLLLIFLASVQQGDCKTAL